MKPEQQRKKSDEDAKTRIFKACIDLLNSDSESLSTTTIARKLPSTNKNTINKYFSEFKALVPIAQAMPHSNFKTWEAVKSLDDSNKEHIDGIAYDYAGKLSDADRQLQEARKSADLSKATAEILKTEITQLTKDIAASESQAETKIDFAKTEIARHIKSINNLESQKLKIKNSLESEIKALDINIIRLDLQRDAYNEKISALETANTNQKKEIAGIEAAKAEIQQSNQDFHRLIVTQQERIKFLIVEIEEEKTRAIPSFAEYLKGFADDESFTPIIKQQAAIEKNSTKEYRMAFAQYKQNRLKQSVV